jgi:hypothetical protein
LLAIGVEDYAGRRRPQGGKIMNGVKAEGEVVGPNEQQ